ncbi:hypothetical protein BJV74DRAFT_874275 [Russula compacta]|nr:hypothetical protein BJV74DRAFT_874275 [Russula compacta]
MPDRVTPILMIVCDSAGLGPCATYPVLYPAPSSGSTPLPPLARQLFALSGL